MERRAPELKSISYSTPGINVDDLQIGAGQLVHLLSHFGLGLPAERDFRCVHFPEQLDRGDGVFTGRKHFIHPVVGEVDLVFEAAELREDPGLSLMICVAERGTPTEEALALLASWAATHEAAATSAAAPTV